MTRHLLFGAFVLAALGCGGGDDGNNGDRDAATDTTGGDSMTNDAPAETPLGDSPTDSAGGDPLDPAKKPPIDTDPTHYPANIWVTSALVKVQPGDSPGSDHWALMSAAQNEFESVQVHVRGDASGMKGLTVAVSDLVDAADPTAKISADTIVVSRETYLDVTLPSDANGLKGKVPDGLVPERDPIFHEDRNAFPYDVPASTTQSVWIDVLVPATAKSGWYQGTITVGWSGGTPAKLPVLLKVWNFALPSTSSLPSAFGLSWNGGCVAAYGSYDACGPATPSGSADDGIEYFHKMYGAFFLDHRVTIGDIVYAPPKADFTHFDAVYGDLLDGKAPTRLQGAKLTGIRYSGNNDATDLSAWATHFKAKGWYDRTYFYHCDEPPNGCSFSAAKSEEDAVHSAVADFQTLLTTDIDAITKNGMLDSVNIITPVVDSMWPRGGTNQRPTYDAFLKMPNKKLYWYQSCDEHESCSNGTSGGAQSTWPSYMADASPVRNRVFQWMAHVFDVHGELYYLSDLCVSDPSTCGAADAWQSIYAFGGHGDGTLIYPGNTAKIDGTHPIPCSSMRLEHIRDGMEDYEFLKALDAAGLSDFAKSNSAWIRSTFDFDTDPKSLLGAREAIGDRLHARSLGK